MTAFQTCLSHILLGTLGTSEIFILLFFIAIIVVIIAASSKKKDTNSFSTPATTSHEQHTNYQTVVVVNEGKSVGLAFLLTFLFGPIGLLYASIAGGIIMILLSIVIGVVTLGAGLIITWIVSIIWAVAAAGNSKQSSTTVVNHNPPNVSASNSGTDKTASSIDKEGLLNQLSQLHALKEKGVLTEEIYGRERQIVLDKLAKATR